MNAPPRKTRRRMAYWMIVLVSMVVIWMMAPGDIKPLEQALAMVIIPSLMAGVMAFITGETYSDHSQRQHGEEKK